MENCHGLWQLTFWPGMCPCFWEGEKSHTPTCCPLCGQSRVPVQRNSLAPAEPCCSPSPALSAAWLGGPCQWSRTGATWKSWVCNTVFFCTGWSGEGVQLGRGCCNSIIWAFCSWSPLSWGFSSDGQDGCQTYRTAVSSSLGWHLLFTDPTGFPVESIAVGYYSLDSILSTQL